MNKILKVVLSINILCTSLHAQDFSSSYFVQNVGQLRDQRGAPRKDIDFALHTPELSVFIGRGTLSYQWIKGDSVARIDARLKGCRTKGRVFREDTLGYFENFYRNSRFLGTARTCRKIVYKDIYPHIDWVLKVSEDGAFEYDFEVGALADLDDIGIVYAGQKHRHLSADGALLSEGILGGLHEQAPKTYTKAGKALKSSYILNDSVLKFQTDDHSGDLVIDPKVQWATYYGDVSSSFFTTIQMVRCDYRANVYAAGATGALKNIATSGAYQEILKATSGGYIQDIFYVKFDSTGKRLYATYFGSDPYFTDFYSIALDKDTLYLSGRDRNNKLGTPGAEQPTIAGSFKTAPFIAKFNHLGQLQWCTYTGGETEPRPTHMQTDGYGHLYITGATNDNIFLATPRAERPAISGWADGYLLKYGTDGRKIWGTFCGGKLGDYPNDIYFIKEDGPGTLCVGGHTFSDTGIATPGSFQPTMRGDGDLFLLKFDSSGRRVWGTYVGGDSFDYSSGMWGDGRNNVYLLGTTYGSKDIATPGAYQTKAAGDADLILFKFNSSGARIWATYFGGAGQEIPEAIPGDRSGNVYISGTTYSKAGIADATAFQPDYKGGDYDGMIAGFTPSGKKLWSSYYGGEEKDQLYALSCDGTNVYGGGATFSKQHIATKGSFIDSVTRLGISPGHGFLFKIQEPQLPFATAISIFKQPDNGVLTLCPNPLKDGLLQIRATAGVSEYALITVFDVAGKAVWTNKYRADAQGTIAESLDLARLHAGTYFLQCKTESEQRMLRFEKL